MEISRLVLRGARAKCVNASASEMWTARGNRSWTASRGARRSRGEVKSSRSVFYIRQNVQFVEQDCFAISIEAPVAKNVVNAPSALANAIANPVVHEQPCVEFDS